MRILITGATSLIGRATARLLAERGDTVAALQRSEPATPDAAVSVTHRADIGDPASTPQIREAVRDCDAVIHLAARVGIVGPWSAFEAANIDGTRRVIDAAIDAGVSRFVHVSTPSVAHAGSSIIGGSADAAQPDAVGGHYARSKAIAEVDALGASRPDFAVLAIRPHLVWGPGDTQLIGRIVDRARQGRLQLIGSGGALIDTTWIDNAATALVAAVDTAPENAGRAFVISNGEPRSVHELLHRITGAAGVAPPRFSVPPTVARGGGRLVERLWEQLGRTDDPPMTEFLAEQLSTAHWFSQRETRAALGWQPHVTLDDGFDRLESWFADNPVGA